MNVSKSEAFDEWVAIEILISRAQLRGPGSLPFAYFVSRALSGRNQRSKKATRHTCKSQFDHRGHRGRRE
jgi:hypothetical protein